MNKIVREHYPVDKLPEDLREGLSSTATVRVVIEEVEDDEVAAARAKLEAWANEYWATRPEDRKPLTREGFLEQLRLLRLVAPRTTAEEAVARIRELRDEWDDR